MKRTFKFVFISSFKFSSSAFLPNKYKFDKFDQRSKLQTEKKKERKKLKEKNFSISYAQRRSKLYQFKPNKATKT